MGKIRDRLMSSDNPCLMVAELSCNHCQNLKVALDTVRAAKEAGADVIKLQTVDPDKITLNSDKKYFQVLEGTLWEGKTLYELEKETYLFKEWHSPIIEEALKIGLSWFSSPFDLEAIDFLEELNCPAYKIASFEITDIELIAKAARTGKPVVISTGIASKEDIELAVSACRKENNNDIVLLKCTSAYPTPLNEVNLRAMITMKEEFSVAVGLSDHTLGSIVPVAATAIGATMIEKHFMLNENIESCDSVFSMTPKDFSDMVTKVREVEESLGNPEITVSQKMKDSRIFARSLFFVHSMQKGDIITEKHVKSIRPGHGLPPIHLKEVLGKSAKEEIEAGTPVSWELIL